MSVILVLISFILNVYAGLAGVGITLFFIPIQVFVAKLFAQVRGRTAGQTDKRIRQISETVDGIGSVKAYGWELPFFELIGALRDAECRTIRKSQLLRSFNQSLYFCVPPLAGFAAFVVFWSTGGELTLPRVFSTISLLQVLRTSVGRMWTRAMETGSEAVASSARVDQFLRLGLGREAAPPAAGAVAEAAPAAAAPSPSSQGRELPLISVSPSSFSYPRSTSSVLRRIELSVSRGQLLVVVGPVGAG
jgi:ABC-type multidrug transport system fused ATPase/permease subunit